MKGSPEKNCTTLPKNIVTLTGVVLMQKTPKCFSSLSGSDCKYRVLESIPANPSWHCQYVWKLLCSSLYDSRCRQNGPVVPGERLLCRITPNHTATGDAFRWCDPFIVIFTLYRLVHVGKFPPTCVHVWLAKLGHMVTRTEVCRYSPPHAMMMVVDVLQPKRVSQENGQKQAVTGRLAAVLF